MARLRTLGAGTVGRLAVVAAASVLLAADAADPPAQSEVKPLNEAARTAAKPAVARWHKNLADWKAEKEHEEADNSFCYVCHVNYQKEELAKTHKPVGVGCETCHGISDKHSEDEDNITPPDVMIARTEVVAFCLECHEKKELLKDDNHEEIFSADAAPEDACTDCHGVKHRLKVRTRRWDKKTGKLVWDDGVRMMEEKPKAPK